MNNKKISNNEIQLEVNNKNENEEKEEKVNINVDKVIEDTIDWNEINFPRQFPLIHYINEELGEDTKRLILFFKFSFFILLSIQIVNLLDTIISVAGNYYPSINILYVFLNIVMMIIFYLYYSYTGYYAYVKKEYWTVIRFYILFFIGLFVYIVIIIIDQGSFNGIIRLVQYAKNGEAGAIVCFVIGIIEIIGYIVMIIIQCFIVKLFTKTITS